MRMQSFQDWLIREVAASRMALVGLYEQKDKLLYVEAPPLRKRYMEAIGIYEEGVLKAELEAYMLRRKAEMIQIAVNRREPINLQEIDAALELERRQRVGELESKDLTLHELPQLTEQGQHTIQRQYREITSAFHPAMNPDITDTQRELYSKALEAYRLQDVEAMKLIYDMLFVPVDLSAFEKKAESRVKTAEERREEYREIASALATDYSLARQLYAFFQPLEEDAVVRDVLETYNRQRKLVETEITGIRAGFPFNAQATLNDKSKTEEYLAELRLRTKHAEAEKAELEGRIQRLTEDTANG